MTHRAPTSFQAWLRTWGLPAGATLLAALLAAPAALGDPPRRALEAPEATGSPGPMQGQPALPSRILAFDRQTRVMVTDGGRYQVPFDVRVLDPNGALRSTQYLGTGMLIVFESEPRGDGPPVLTEIRVLDTSPPLPS